MAQEIQNNKDNLNSTEISVSNKNVDISIVIVNYNVRDYLNDCLKSIYQSKTNLNFEVIIVDNNSNDNSCTYLKPHFPQAKFIELNENLGFAKANNLGFKQASGKYVLILNPDTIVSTDTLQTMYDFMEEHTEVTLAGCKVLNPDGTFQLPCRRGFPTPWTAFSKLFGLQKLFPKSKLFAKYNQTFRSIDETYYVDAVMGAFMFARLDKILEIGGFEEKFFMYGEDLDLCYRIYQNNGKVAYFHQTSIIHIKGESTRRSSIDETKHFYQAMEIFVKKYYSNSKIFLLILHFGIFIRSFIAHLSNYKKDFPVIFLDLLIANISLLFSTTFKFERLFGFPNYAYPTVFIVISLVVFSSQFAVGEYFEGEHSYRKLLFGYLISFFFLSALTYFFKNYAFSRGVLLLTITFSLIFSSLIRFFIFTYKKSKNRSKNKIKKIAFVVSKTKINQVVEDIEKYKLNKLFQIQGVFCYDSIFENNYYQNLKILGNLDYLLRNVQNFQIDELIVYKKNEMEDELNLLITRAFNKSIKLHIINQFEEFFASEIINDIVQDQPYIKNFRLLLPRYKFAKRLIDLLFAIFMLTIASPITIYKNYKYKKYFKSILNVFKGKFSLIGIYELENIQNYNAKPGLYNLAMFSKDKNLSQDSIKKLNDYYELNYSLALDFDILTKSIFKGEK